MHCCWKGSLCTEVHVACSSGHLLYTCFDHCIYHHGLSCSLRRGRQRLSLNRSMASLCSLPRGCACTRCGTRPA